MFGFKKNKKTTNIKTNNEFYDRNGPVYQAAEHYSVKPEYFNYDKIQLNKFLTDDETYRNKLSRDNKICDKFENWVCNDNCCCEQRYISDMQAMNEINNKLEMESFLSLEHARKAYNENQKFFINYDGTWLSQVRKPRDNNEKIFSFFSLQKKKYAEDNQGLTDEDYANISKNLREQAYAISNKTKRMLLDQKTKILDLESLRDHHINSNIESGKYKKRVIYQEKDFFWNLRKNPYAGVDQKVLAEHNYNNLIKKVDDWNNEFQKNIPINQYNINAINAGQNYLDQQARLQEPESIVDIARGQKTASDTIDLDKLTPYNVVKPNIRINKNNKRNISL